ncbi:Gfo/Idh/MocA family protein [Pedobacter arcticus]|uniref:Gfo/Idh/MocA family protein n=1 Tax=Pedobacter arcticus TaxID=752140 RepID=UPI0002F73D8D|nr:Gfo/Idh/MocA family oxidoreductase [Pedobacter arcticus]
MSNNNNRRNFIRTIAIGGAGIGVSGLFNPIFAKPFSTVETGKRVGIIGLDTSHAVAFTKTLNEGNADPVYLGYKVVAAYPHGSLDIKTSVDRIPGYVKEVKELGVEIVSSIDELLKKVDVVLLETNDGRRHLEQAIPVLKAGKRLFIDKPITASLKDAIEIFGASKKYNTPLFSSSSLRYMDGIVTVKSGTIGKVLGAQTYSPAIFEKTHPDFFWYGIHGIEMLYALMGTGCKEVTRVHTEDYDVVTGVWEDGRIGSFRGIRAGKKGYGATVFGEKNIVSFDKYSGYNPLLKEIVKFFDTGILPVPPEETLEICAFMEAADESRRMKGASVEIKNIYNKLK